MLMEYNELLDEVTAFAKEKGFTQHHNPKDVAIAISVEAAELLEHFMWHDTSEFTNEKKREISYEMADIMIYLMHMSKAMDVDLLKATKEKMEINKKRF